MLADSKKMRKWGLFHSFGDSGKFELIEFKLAGFYCIFLSNDNEWLTIHIRTACSGGVFANSVPRQALKSACIAAIDSCKS